MDLYTLGLVVWEYRVDLSPDPIGLSDCVRVFIACE